jgi:hypothetical protein
MRPCDRVSDRQSSAPVTFAPALGLVLTHRSGGRSAGRGPIVATSSSPTLDPSVEIDYRAEYIAQQLRARKRLTRRRREQLLEELDGIAAATGRLREVAGEIAVRVDEIHAEACATERALAEALGRPVSPCHLELVPTGKEA